MNNGDDEQMGIIGDWNHSVSSLMTCLFSCGGHDGFPVEPLFLIVFMV